MVLGENGVGVEVSAEHYVLGIGELEVSVGVVYSPG